MRKAIADLLSVTLIGTTVVLTLALYPDLPDPMPTHWNAAGEVDGYLSRPWGVAVLPITAVFVILVMKAVALMTPRDQSTEDHLRVISLLQVVLVGFICAIAVLVLLEALGHDTRLNQVIFGGIGLLLIFIGRFFGRIRRNFFLGIRTPWTLRNDEVWSRTHRLGGILFMLAGLLLFISAFVQLDLRWTIGAVAVLAVFPVGYSYFVYRQIRQSADRDTAA